jgi:dimethylglycine dehydrogenase
MELIPEDVDRIAPELEIAFARYPALAKTGIKRWINGAFTFTPDGNPLVGPVGPRGYWVACGVMAGFSQGGGVGKALAEWMIHGATEQDVYGMDVARYGAFHSNREYLRQTTGQFYSRRFVMTFPNEQLPAARPLKTAPAHAEMTTAGARWGVSWGLEVPLYFAPSQDFTEPGTLKRSTAFPIIRDEALAVRDAAGLLDISGFARYEVTGAGAEAWLDRLLACKLPGPGRARLAPMLAEDGRLKGDLTVFNWGDGRYWLMGSYYLRSFHLRWFADHAGADTSLRDISDDWIGFSVQGPQARAVLERLTGPLTLPMMGCAELDVGLTRARVARLSLSGELAYEINVPAAFHATLRRQLLAAGADLGLREVGFAAMLSLRLEKSIGIWNAEYAQGYTPAMTGLDRWVADKPGFIGREAFLAAPPPARRLVMLRVDADGADATGFEPVWQNGAKVGFTTSGGYGHRVGQSLALAQVRADLAEPGTKVTVHVVGRERGAEVIALSPYDPKGERMRA